MRVQECNESLQGNKNLFDYTHRGKYVYVHLEIIASLGDQLEMRSINYLMSDNSTYFFRYSYIANVGATWRRLLSCPGCHNGMRNKRYCLI